NLWEYCNNYSDLITGIYKEFEEATTSEISKIILQREKKSKYTWAQNYNINNKNHLEQYLN
ncbi:7139_t:CDS:1, partial [Entrophospora sp. SA101]